MNFMDAALVFKALSDPNRLQILQLLQTGEKCACKLLKHFQITQPTLSHHMHILFECEIVHVRKSGKWMHYSLNVEHLRQISEYVNSLCDNAIPPCDFSQDDDCDDESASDPTASSFNDESRSNPSSAGSESATTSKPKVAFVCVHNSCRSQIAEALGKAMAGDVFESYSAGTHSKDRINPDAVRIMMETCGIDLEATQHPKLLSAIPPVDVVITMGCNVDCPYLPCKMREDWGLSDPTGQPDEAFKEVIGQIREKILQLKERLSEDGGPRFS